MIHARTIIGLCIAAAGCIFTPVIILAVFFNNPTVYVQSSPAITRVPFIQKGVLPKPELQPAVLRFFGDIMLGRNVEAKILATKDTSYPFNAIRPLLKSADAVIANLEGPVMKKHIPTPTGSVRFSFDRDIVKTLAAEHIGYVSLANNHTLDYGGTIFNDMWSWLSEQLIMPFGHPQLAEEKYVRSVDVNGQQVMLIGYNAFPNKYDDDKIRLIKDMREKYPSAFIVVCIHWGDEYQLHSNRIQRAFAYKLIDAGTDLIIGSHPHVVQEIEVYQNRVIFYSLGNFIFDQYFSEETQEGLGVELQLDRSQSRYRVYPLESIKSQPTLMEGDKRSVFLKELVDRSATSTPSTLVDGYFSLQR